jgi:hypothetical protein
MLNAGPIGVSSFQLAGLVQFSVAGWQWDAKWRVSSVAGSGVLSRKS